MTSIDTEVQVGALSPGIAVVTGAATGLGSALAQWLLARGWTVVGTYNKSVSADPESENLTLIQVDLADSTLCAGFADAVLRQFGPPTLLINCAGINIDKPLFDINDDDWDTVFAVNVRAPFILTRELGSKMISLPAASIVNIGATTGIRPRVDGANYCASKAALHHLTKTSALELRPTVTVNTLIPGLIRTDEAWNRLGLTESSSRDVALAGIPAGRIAEPEEFAEALGVIVGPGGRYINGQKIIVDGGQFMY
ncbi:SDR family NAD(P)-dependent oxidoreductase [Rhodococcus artemisiae]|uniref:SDR family oxidoreductase n=1 Tax=Rhodococcus artemisiae TaxID=714159 RepID=A0ABU7LBY9_9NOCA|nr:SDR family oxidoreductase [Rhodococcus artemisiae]MEE2059064.1 SDR family oxidoreductase [Rhodococcus artemisiae]